MDEEVKWNNFNCGKKLFLAYISSNLGIRYWLCYSRFKISQEPKVQVMGGVVEI